VKNLPTGQSIVGPAHGASSEVVVTTRAKDLFDVLQHTYPWIENVDRIAVEQYCRAEARARLLNEFVMDMLMTAESHKQLNAAVLAQATRADEVAMRAAAAVGLSPEGRMKIAKDAGFASALGNQTIASLEAQGAQLRRAK
jgi:hypothetical protein